MILTYCIGDIHGRFSKLQALVNRCINDAAGTPMRFIFLGDYIDRGSQSRETVEYLIRLQRPRPDQVICLKGNHEDMALAAHDDDAWIDNWLANQGRSTLQSYNISSPQDLPPAHVQWLQSLPTSHRDGHRFYVHAGIHPERPLHAQDEFDLLWIREPFLSSTEQFELCIVHGHTPQQHGRPDMRPNRLNIDTGAGHGGPLTAAVFDDEHRHPLYFLTST
jgi:serine/threonine protein phosphatase 1